MTRTGEWEGLNNAPQNSEFLKNPHYKKRRTDTLPWTNRGDNAPCADNIPQGEGGVGRQLFFALENQRKAKFRSVCQEVVPTLFFKKYDWNCRNWAVPKLRCNLLSECACPRSRHVQHDAAEGSSELGKKCHIGSSPKSEIVGMVWPRRASIVGFMGWHEWVFFLERTMSVPLLCEQRYPDPSIVWGGGGGNNAPPSVKNGDGVGGGIWPLPAPTVS